MFKKYHHHYIQPRVIEDLFKKHYKSHYQATKLPFFPKPDWIFLSRKRKPDPPIAFELKPPHANKREYLTGLGQAVTYQNIFPKSYLVIPNETIDDFNIPFFILDTISKNDLRIGLISYDYRSFKTNILINSIEKEIKNTKKLEKEINHARAWSFWMDTELKEVAEMLILIDNVNESRKKITKDQVLEEIWDFILSKRFSSSKSSYILNYSLFLDHLDLWTGKGKLTILGNRLKEIAKKYGKRSDEFKDALHYLLLTKGGYLELFKLVNEIQSKFDFSYKGNESDLIKELRKERKKYDITARSDYSKDMDILDDFAKNGDEWLRIISSEIFRRGHGNGISQVLTEIQRRFPSFNSSLETDFLLTNQYIRSKGYPINWDRIIYLISKGDDNLEIF